MSRPTANLMLVAPKVEVQRCGTCKFQRVFPEFGNQKVCAAQPPALSLIPELLAAIPPGTAVTSPAGKVVQMPAGGLQIVTSRAECRFPPCLDHWGCGQWKPRFEGTS